MTRVILGRDPGHDDAIALLLALASAELALLGGLAGSLHGSPYCSVA
jgi:inosine-uridine nucleoside N-ribohydrolase